MKAAEEAELHECCVEDALGNRGWLLLVSLSPPAFWDDLAHALPGRQRAFLRG